MGRNMCVRDVSKIDDHGRVGNIATALTIETTLRPGAYAATANLTTGYRQP
jgi:hypothetical protein